MLLLSPTTARVSVLRSSIICRNQKSATFLADKLPEATGIVMDNLALGGLTPNTRHGKTEVLAKWRGKGSFGIRRSFADSGHCLHFPSRFQFGPLRCVGSYKHLGTWITLDLNPLKEFRSRLGQAHATVTAHKAAIFSNRALSIKTKFQLFDSLVASGLFYNSATWMPLSERHLKTFVQGVLKLLRRIAILHFGIMAREWNESILLLRLGASHPTTCLRCCRLSLLSHLVHSGGDDVWAAVQQFRPWVALLEDDIRWLQAQRKHPLPFGELCHDWSSWSLYIGESGPRWKAVIQQARKHALGQQMLRAEWDEWHREAVSILLHEGGLPKPLVASSSSEEHYCLRCEAIFDSKSAWAVHCFRKHGRRTDARRVAQGQVCGHCLTAYASHAALIRHLTYSKSCKRALVRRDAVVEHQPSVNSRHELHTRPAIWDPHMRAEGPLCEMLPANEFDDLTVYQFQLLFQLRELQVQFSRAKQEQIEVLIKDLLRTTSLHQSELEEVLVCWWQAELVPADSTPWLQAVVEILGKLCSSYFFTTSSVETTRSADASFIEAWLRAPPSLQTVQRPLRYRPILMGHLFSGRRRENDLQHALERLSMPGNHTSSILSIDIIFSERTGNLMCPQVQHVFRQAIAANMLVVLFAGPPCETWSRARLRGGVKDKGPKAVRSATSLEALATLSLRELTQVSLGNSLLGIAIRLAILMCICGGLFVLEHPSTPPEGDAPSIWKLPLLRLCMTFDQVQYVEILAGLFGAISAKPTTFLIFNGPPRARDLMMKFRTRETVPMNTTIGRNDRGEWNTAVLKEYAAGLCTALAQVALRYLELRGSEDHLCTLPSDVQAAFHDLIVGLDFTAERGPDFHPASLN